MQSCEGGSAQNRKYNGKEFIEAYGLDEYDSQARHYYPAIARTTTMDPLAEKYYSISPYAWCANNPINVVDLNGMDWYKNDSTGYYTWFEGNDEHDGYTYIGEQGSVSIPMNIQGNLQITGFIGADLNNTWIPMSRKRLGRNSLMWTLDPWNNSYKSLWISAYYGNLRFFTSNYLRMYIMQNGNIGINTNSPTSLLEINGTISADEYIVKISSGADYVFDKEYQLMLRQGRHTEY